MSGRRLHPVGPNYRLPLPSGKLENQLGMHDERDVQLSNSTSEQKLSSPNRPLKAYLDHVVSYVG